MYDNVFVLEDPRQVNGRSPVVARTPFHLSNLQVFPFAYLVNTAHNAQGLSMFSFVVYFEFNRNDVNLPEHFK